MPHDPMLLLEDVRLAARDIQEFVRDRSFVDYANDRLLRAGVERLFILIGEALSRWIRKRQRESPCSEGCRFSQHPRPRLRVDRPCDRLEDRGRSPSDSHFGSRDAHRIAVSTRLAEGRPISRRFGESRQRRLTSTVPLRGRSCHSRRRRAGARVRRGSGRWPVRWSGAAVRVC